MRSITHTTIHTTIHTITRTAALTLATALGAATLSIAVVPAASAATTSPGSPSATATTGGTGGTSGSAIPEQWRGRLELACARVPNAISRTERLTERLAGDADTRGSLLWLTDKANAAREAGREEIAAALENRLEVRTQLADLLPQRLEALQQAQVSCDEAGL